jgi:hypothetical protein
MAKRYDVCSPRPRKDSDKPFWHRVGTAWEGEKGINITFDSLPLPDKEGRVSVALFVPREKDTAPKSAEPARDDMDSDIPF